MSDKIRGLIDDTFALARAEGVSINQILTSVLQLLILTGEDSDEALAHVMVQSVAV
jgi:hypothetical protein